MSEDKTHEFEAVDNGVATCRRLIHDRNSAYVCGFPASAAIHQVAKEGKAPERIYLPADTDHDTWNVLAKNPSRNWRTGGPPDPLVEYARVHQVAEPCVDGDPMMHGPKPYRWCVTHNDLMLRCDRSRPGATNHERARQAAEKISQWIRPDGGFLDESAKQEVTAIILETCFGGEGQRLSPLAKEQRPVSRLADSIVGAVFHCIHEMENESTDGRRDPAWWLDTLKAKSAVIKLLERHFASPAPLPVNPREKDNQHRECLPK